MKTSLFLILLTLSLTTVGQSLNGTYRVAYSGHNFNHPGLNIAKDYAWKTKVKEKQKKKRLKTVQKSNIFLPQVNFYNHVYKEFNLSLGAEVVRQRVKKRCTHEWGVGLSLMRSFNAGSTYKVEDGEVKQIRLAGQNYLAPSVSYAFGYTLNKKAVAPTTLFIKPMTYLMLPYNGSILPNVNLQIGIKRSLKFNTNE
ncbi:MAG: hypothetical protein JJ975_16455 [Bacteroidia bacterium]|nr:hypothetical protein [Bacteroidia bacterium]